MDKAELERLHTLDLRHQPFVALINMPQSSLPALAAAFYPTQGRATGIAWMMGIGRFGVAELTRRQFGFSEIFTVMAIPGLIAAVALFIKQLVSTMRFTVFSLAA